MWKNNRTVFWVFITIWLVINLLQAGFTGLLHDEAYYFFYSRHLAWGYYDHPPFTALLIRAGSTLFPGEFGARFFFVLLSAGTIAILRKLSEAKNEIFFAVIAFSFIFLQLTGFLALPDSVMVFFTALFFLAYKKYCKNYSIKNGIVLGLVMAALFYSKYLGILVVFFTLLSNLSLFRKGSFWLSVLVTSLLFAPHLYWQYEHGFPSFYYHLTERSHDEVFRWSNFADYIIGQFGQVNPLIFIPVIIFLVAFKPHGQYEKALKYSAAGSLILPFLLMIKGRVEANWTMAGLVPLFLLTTKIADDRPKMARYIYVSGWITVALIFMIRIILIADIIPEKYRKTYKLEISGWKEFSEELSRIAGDRPAVFLGSYQVPSLYRFYTGKEATSFNNSIYRSNQYDLENLEEKFAGRDFVLFFPGKSIPFTELRSYGFADYDSIENPNGKYLYYIYDSNFRAYNRLPIKIGLNIKSYAPGEVAEIEVMLKNPGSEPVRFSEGNGKVYLAYSLYDYGKTIYFWKFKDITPVELKDEYHASFRMKMPLKPGIYYLRVSIKSGWLPAGINSKLVKIKVIE